MAIIIICCELYKLLSISIELLVAVIRDLHLNVKKTRYRE